MARKPFFGSSGAPAIAKMDMRAATEPGRAFGQMFANLGKIAADSLEKYRVNNEKKEREENIYKMSKTFLSENPDIAESSFGASTEEEIEAVAQGFKKNPDMPKLVSQFLTMSREEEASKLRRRELKKLKDRERSFESIMDPEIAGELFEDAKGFIQLFRDKKIDAETAIPLLSAFQKSKDEAGKISSTTTIVDEDGTSKRVGLNKKGDIVKEIGQAPSNSFFGSPEDQAKADVYKQQNTRALDFIDATKNEALASSRSMTAARRVQDLLDKGVQTGGINQLKANLSTLAQSFGVELPDNIKKETANTQALMAASGEFLFSAISQTKGSISEKEMAIFESISPGIKQSVEGNRAMIEFIQAIGTREKAKLQLIRDLEKKGAMPTKIRAAVEDFMMQNDMSGKLEEYLGEIDPQPISAPGPQPQQPQGITLPRSGGVFTPL
jgi:hypothetical protein